MLANLLNSKFNLKTSVISTRFPNQWKISINKKSIFQLRNLIEDYMIGNMIRKII